MKHRSLGVFPIRVLSGRGNLKAEVARCVGRSSALSAERHYVLRIFREVSGMVSTATQGYLGFARSIAIVVGLAATAIGYCVGSACRPVMVAGRRTSRAHV
jgi:hypothetical protein